MQKLLLCTDLDRTLVPNGKHAESPGARELFSRFVSRSDITLAYVTGRNRALIQQCIKEYDLPTPDFAIADVGTSVYRIEQGVWHHWLPWDQEIDGDWQGRSADELHALLKDIPALRLQEAEKQNTHKLSYYVDLDADSASIVAKVESRLQQHGICEKVIWSEDEADHIGLLDILPASASKRHAIEFMMESGHYDADHTVFAGDSGNDLDVLLSPIHSVLVANAHPDVRAALAEASPQNSYIAVGDFLGLNGCYAAGILEGVAHFCHEFVPVIEALQESGARDGLSDRPHGLEPE